MWRRCRISAFASSFTANVWLRCQSVKGGGNHGRVHHVHPSAAHKNEICIFFYRLFRNLFLARPALMFSAVATGGKIAAGLLKESAMLSVCKDYSFFFSFGGAAGIHQRCVLGSCSFRQVLLKGVGFCFLTTESLGGFQESPDLKHSWGCRTLNAACYGVLRGMLASQDWTVYPEPRSGAHDFLLNHGTLFCSFLFWASFFWFAIKVWTFFSFKFWTSQSPFHTPWMFSLFLCIMWHVLFFVYFIHICWMTYIYINAVCIYSFIVL